MADDDMSVSGAGKTDVDASMPETFGLCDKPENAAVSLEDGVGKNAEKEGEKEDAAANAALITLDRFSDDRLITKIELAEALSCSPRTINRMVEKFEIPPGIILGGRCVWLAGKVKLWLASSASKREAEAEKEALRRRLH